MTTPVFDQLRAYAANLDAQAQLTTELAAPRRRSQRPVLAMAAASVVLAAMAVAVVWANITDSDPSAISPASGGVDDDAAELEAAIRYALANAKPGERTTWIPVGEPWHGEVWTSDGPVEMVLTRTVGQRQDGDAFCFDATCHGEGLHGGFVEGTWWSTERTLRTAGVFGRRYHLRLYVPHEAGQLTFAWDDGSVTVADTVQPFGPGTLRFSAVVGPFTTGGILSVGDEEHRIDLSWR